MGALATKINNEPKVRYHRYTTVNGEVIAQKMENGRFGVYPSNPRAKYFYKTFDDPEDIETEFPPMSQIASVNSIEELVGMKKKKVVTK